MDKSQTWIEEHNELIKLEDVSDVPIYSSTMQEDISERKAEGFARIWSVLSFDKGVLTSLFTYPTIDMAKKSVKNIRYRYKNTWSTPKEDWANFVIIEGAVYYAGADESWNKLEKY